MFKNTLVVLMAAALLIVLVVAGPLVIIWSILEWKEVLVNGADPWNWRLWLATLFIGVFIRGNVKISKKD
jgi:hypothetical protein